MIDITLVTNEGSGVPRTISVADGTSLGQLLELFFEGNLDDMSVRVRSGGMSEEKGYDYELRNGDRVSLAPKKIEGAVA